MEKRRIYWWACCAGAAVLSVLTFTPVVSPAGSAEPYLFGVPRTLWAGILVTIGLVLLTAMATRVVSAAPAEEGEDA